MMNLLSVDGSLATRPHPELLFHQPDPDDIGARVLHSSISRHRFGSS